MPWWWESLQQSLLQEPKHRVISTYFDGWVWSISNQICNLDETGMPLEHRPTKVVTKKVWSIHVVSQAGRKQTSLSLGVWMLVTTTFHLRWFRMWRPCILIRQHEKFVVHCMHSYPMNGSTMNCLRFFLLYVRPLLLLMDGHNSRRWYSLHFHQTLLTYANHWTRVSSALWKLTTLTSVNPGKVCDNWIPHTHVFIM